MNQLLAQKSATYQTWTASGKRIPVTILRAQGNVVMETKDNMTVVGFGSRKDKNTAKSQLGWQKKIGVTGAVRLIRQLNGVLDGKQAGESVKPSDVFKVGDIVKVTGTSKGMGFAGGMKRHGFHGGPKTHGQSDRWRAPGGSSSGTTLGRLFRNKRMAGRGGNKIVSVLNLQVVSLDDNTNEIQVKGVVPGALHGAVTITKLREAAFEGLLQKKTALTDVKVEEKVETVADESPIVTTDHAEVKAE